MLLILIIISDKLWSELNYYDVVVLFPIIGLICRKFLFRKVEFNIGVSKKFAQKRMSIRYILGITIFLGCGVSVLANFLSGKMF